MGDGNGSGVTAAQLTVDVATTPVLSYTLAHCGVPVVNSLTITNDGPPAEDVTVRVLARDSEGVLGGPAQLTVDLAHGSNAIPISELVLDPDQMLQVGERRPGAVVVEVEVDGDIIGTLEQPVRVLAAQQWMARPRALGLELLASHVMPNHPAITALLTEAAAVLKDSTGSSSIEGYQSGPDRVDQIVGAVCTAIRNRDIAYANPPASWTDDGQKVRTPGDVLDDRLGTCLDTTVVVAAALEQAGLHPLLWVVKGHAFAGYWRVEQTADEVVSTDARLLVNEIGRGHVRLIETTMLTEGADGSTLAELHDRPVRHWLGGDLADVVGVTDVVQARFRDIVPLPARTRDADGGVRVVVYARARHSSAPDHAAAAPSGPDRRAPRRDVPPRVQQWKDALLDLSLRNRLINYTPSSGLALAAAAEQLGPLEDLINAGSPVSLVPGNDIAAIWRERGVHSALELPADQLVDALRSRSAVHADVTAAAYPTRLRALAHKARTVREETGANNLYLALGSLVWEVEGKPLRSPLVLVPVTLSAIARTGRYRIALDQSGSSTPNYCLLEKLRAVHGLEVPGLADPVLDDSGIDLDRTLDSVRATIAEHALPYRVEPTADLALLQFAKFRLWKDLDESWSALAQNPLVHHLIHDPTGAFVDPVAAGTATPDLDELAAECPVPGDASQLAAVAEARAGRTFVLEGPPGTGKSQTITNLLTRAVADGKRVLFVAEKRAALDVVARRLDAVGMGSFVLDLHDKASKPSEVRTQVRRSMEVATEVDRQGLAADLEVLRSARRALRRYATRLHEPNAAGLTFYSARTQLLATASDVTPLPVPAPFVRDAPDGAVDTIRTQLRLLPDPFDAARPRADHPWAFVDTVAVDLGAAHRSASAIDSMLATLDGHPDLRLVLDRVATPEDLRVAASVLGGPAVGLEVLDETRQPRWDAATADVVTTARALAGATHPALEHVDVTALTLPLRALHADALTAAESGRLGRRKRLTEVRDRLVPVVRAGREIDPGDLVELLSGLVALQDTIGQLVQRIGSIPGVTVPEGWTPLRPGAVDDLQAQVARLRTAGRAVAPGARSTELVDALRSVVASGRPVPDDVVAVLPRVAGELTRLVEATGSSTTRLTQWAGEEGLLVRWRAAVRERAAHQEELPSLQRWTALLGVLEPLRTLGLGGIRTLLLSGRVPADTAVTAFDEGLAATALEERESATGFDAFDAAAHEKVIERFTTRSGAVRRHLGSALPAEVLDARPFDASTPTANALRRELAKQRRGMGVRELMTTYGREITAAMPCVLVSPDSVARFFPAEAGLFDLVVFDEASQVRVADAVGALGRARAAVIVGDSKQMPPTSFADPAADDDATGAPAETTAVEDQESVLSECISADVPRLWLSWHYRSQDESLIAFSNRHYYEDKLSSFPAPVGGPADPGPDGRGVSLVRVDGVFHRSGSGKLLRTNPVEAAAVVADLQARFTASPREAPSVGVVTFNQQQRALVEALVRDSGDDRMVDALDRSDGGGLFVKNLENVQGDERDVILFSTGFSPNDRGALPLNFGPLNRGGGERRLNVAVTRARRQVVVFTSFDPGMLRAEDTSSLGIKHLRAYLDLAAGGTEVPTVASRRATVEDRHRGDVAAALERRGYVTRTGVGLSEFKVDISVARAGAPDEPIMAVLLDGEAWSRRRTVGDRDGLPTEVLGRMLCWPAVERVWMPSWLADGDAVLDRLDTAMAGARTRSRRPVVSPASPVAPVVTAPGEPTTPVPEVEAPAQRAEAVPPPEPAPSWADVAPVPSWADPAPAPPATESDLVPPWAEPVRAETAVEPEPVRAAPAPPAVLDAAPQFRPWSPSSAGDRSDLDQLDTTAAAVNVRSVLRAVIAAEGPVHRDRLARLTAAAFGLARVNEARRDAITGLIPASNYAGDFAWPKSLDRSQWDGFRASATGSDRPLEHVAPEEIGNAMVALCRSTGGLPQDELFAQTLQVFGFRRRTPAQVALLKNALTRVLRSDRLTRQADDTITT